MVIKMKELNNCKGILGKIFGHKFVSRIVEYTPSNCHGMKARGYDIEGIIKAQSHKRYVVVCKRCGEKVIK